jgi:PAS domain S-box-containing protein
MDGEGVVRDWNPSAEATFGYRREEVLGRELAELIIPGPLRDAHRNALQRYLETHESTILGRRVELSALRSSGSEFRVELAITQLPDSDEPLFAGFVRDLSSREVTTAESLRLQQRMAFLAQAGLVLDRSLDYNDTLRGLADLTVPELSELTVIDLLDDDGRARSAVAAAADPSKAGAVEAIRRAHPLDRNSTHPVAGVLRTAKAVLLPSMTADFQREIAQGAEHYELMRRLRYHSAIVVPLVARRRVLGTLSLLRMQDSASYDRDDLVLAEELARRAALAIDNARLFETTRHIARTLQQSLLPRSLPEIPGVQIAGRYLAAAEGQEVGGDFFDAFAIGGNRWGVGIGDVCGKGPEAAALTALARYTFRALGDRGPATVLQSLNDALLREADRTPGSFLTAVFAVAQREDDRLELEVAVGGHPPPLVLHDDGSAEQIAARGPLLGLSPDARYRPVTTVLTGGDTMVLHTDGLTDARAPGRILSDSDLIDLVARGRGLSAEELARFLEHAATGDEPPRDDIAVLVIRVAG